MYCRKCGFVMPGGSTVCPNCGENQVTPPKTAALNKGLIITAWAAIGLAVVAIVLVLVFLVFPAKPPQDGNMDSEVAGRGIAASTGEVTSEPTVAPSPAATAAAPRPTKFISTPAPGAKTVFANGFEIDLTQYLAETWWASSGKSLINPDAVAAASGYPRTYNLAEREVQYIFDTDAETITALQFDDKDDLLAEKEVSYRLDPYGFYIYAFDADAKIGKKTYTVYSKFFVCDDVLYEVQMIGDDEVSNYIAYEPYGP